VGDCVKPYRCKACDEATDKLRVAEMLLAERDRRLENATQAFAAMQRGFIDVRDPQTNKLLFRFDPRRAIIEVRRGAVKTVIDLTEYYAEGGAGEHDMYKLGMSVLE
jgi:hypothetical protein